MWDFGTNLENVGIFVNNSFIKYNNIKLRQKKLLTVKFLRKIIWVLKKKLKIVEKVQESF